MGRLRVGEMRGESKPADNDGEVARAKQPKGEKRRLWYSKINWAIWRRSPPFRVRCRLRDDRVAICGPSDHEGRTRPIPVREASGTRPPRERRWDWVIGSERTSVRKC